MTPETIDATARTCFETHRTRTRYGPLDAAVRNGPLDDAYRIQDALHRIMAKAGRGDIAGWKIALTSKAMQQMTGVDQPAAGAIFSTVVHPSPHRRVDLAAYHHLGVEFEVAVRLGDDLPASGGPWTRASVASKVAACLPAFELVEDGDADYKTLDAFTLIAQNTWNGGVVLGAPVTAWRGIDWKTAVTRCWINDAPGGQGKTGDALGHPFEAVAWLANLLNRRGRQLGRDMIVMTGSSITTKFPAPRRSDPLRHRRPRRESRSKCPLASASPAVARRERVLPCPASWRAVVALRVRARRASRRARGLRVRVVHERGDLGELDGGPDAVEAGHPLDELLVEERPGRRVGLPDVEVRRLALLGTHGERLGARAPACPRTSCGRLRRSFAPWPRRSCSRSGT